MRTKYVYREGRMVNKETGKPDLRGSNLPPQAPQLCLANAYSSNPVISPVDHTILQSRQDLREHNKRNDVIDVGNDRAAQEYRRNVLDSEKQIQKDVAEACAKIEQNNPAALAAIKNVPDSKDFEHRATRQYQ